jgi:hypothetical protein
MGLELSCLRRPERTSFLREAAYKRESHDRGGHNSTSLAHRKIFDLWLVCHTQGEIAERERDPDL